MPSLLLKEIRHNPLLWLLVFVPVVFAGEKLAPEAHTLLFVLSVLAIVPLAALLEAVARHAPVARAELVGLAPRAAFDGWPGDVAVAGRATIEDAL